MGDELKAWLQPRLTALLDGEVDPAESLSNYVVLILGSSDVSGSALEALLVDKLSEFLGDDTADFVRQLMGRLTSGSSRARGDDRKGSREKRSAESGRDARKRNRRASDDERGAAEDVGPDPGPGPSQAWHGGHPQGSGGRGPWMMMMPRGPHPMFPHGGFPTGPSAAPGRGGRGGGDTPHGPLFWGPGGGRGPPPMGRGPVPPFFNPALGMGMGMMGMMGGFPPGHPAAMPGMMMPRPAAAGGGGRSRSSPGRGEGSQRPPSAREVKSLTLRCTGVPQWVTDAKLRSHFKHFGRIMRIVIKQDTPNSNSDGKAYNTALVQFATAEQAKACKESPSAVLNNRFIRVMYSDENIVDPDDLLSASQRKIDKTAEVVRAQQRKAKAEALDKLSKQKEAILVDKLKLCSDMLRMLEGKDDPKGAETKARVDELTSELEAVRSCDSAARLKEATEALAKAEVEAVELGARIPTPRTSMPTKGASPSPRGGKGRGGPAPQWNPKKIDNRTRNLLVGNIPQDTSEGHLRAHFAAFGPVEQVVLGSSNSAIIKYSTRRSAEVALQHGPSFGESTLSIGWHDAKLPDDLEGSDALPSKHGVAGQHEDEQEREQDRHGSKGAGNDSDDEEVVVVVGEGGGGAGPDQEEDES
jgi:RNA recognition motif-containing protein